MVMRGAKRKGVRYYGPFAHAYAIRETLDLLLRTFPIRTCTNNKLERHQRLGPALPLRPHREVLGAVRRRHRPEPTTTPSSASCSTSSTASTDAIVERLETADGGGGRRSWSSSGRPACGTSWRSVRKAIERQQMVGDAGRGLRRHRHRRRRARGVGPGLLRPPGPDGRPQGAGASTRWRSVDPPALVGPHPRAALRRRPGRGRPQGGAGPRRAGGPRALRGVPRPRAGARRSGSGCRSGATSGPSSRR